MNVDGAILDGESETIKLVSWIQLVSGFVLGMGCSAFKCF